jgi:Ca2+-binding RTX toxin-like protein
MFTLHDLADQVRQTAQQMSAGGYVVLGNRFLQAADLILSIADAGTDPEDIAPDQNELIRDLLNIGASFGAGEWLAVRGMAATVAILNPVSGAVIFVGAAAFGTIVGSLLDFLHEEWGITLVGEEIDYSSVDAPVSILGTIMQDSFISTLHNDTVHGLAGDDTLINVGGSDEVFGGWGSDTLDYSSRADGILVHIDGLIDSVGLEKTYTVQHATGTDVVSSVETVIGTSAADEFDICIGAGASTVELQGDDGFTIRNSAGPSGNTVAVLNGGQGFDKLYIGDDASHTYVNLASNYAQYGMQNAVGPRFSIHEIECVLGNEGMDEIHGDDDENVLFGAGGADRLFGGGGDDFIFFDEADGANVNGGAGRDVAVAVGQDGVTVDMLDQGLEVAIGGGGADLITVGEADSGLFAAGGGSGDRFIVTNGDGFIEGGPRVLWGGSGADTFEFEWASYARGIAVVQIDGLTEETFSSLTLADLGLGDLDLSMFQAIILNPDQDDRFLFDGQVFSSGLHVVNDGFSASVRSHTSSFITEALGRPLSVQGLYQDNYVVETTPNFEWDDMENIISISRSTGTFDADGNEIFTVTAYDPLDDADQAEAMDVYNYYGTHTDQLIVQVDTDPQYNAFWNSLWVVGGTFSGEALGANGLLAAGPLSDPGNTPFDWLLVA